MNESLQRQPHAAFDLLGRRQKAMKVRFLLELERPLPRPLRLLEIGTGSGAIAHYFATDADLQSSVAAVDVVDQRSIRDGYAFQRVAGVELPFADESFDVVISNHVLEHVGDEAAQIGHVGEISRVLRRGGTAYLASPNRWQVVEPHYGLAFLSWLPHAWRTPYLKLSGKGSYYDCEPLRMRPLERMLDRVGLRYRNVCVPALHYLLRVERPDAKLARMAGMLPDALLQSLRRICPTHIYLLTHPGPGE